VPRRTVVSLQDALACRTIELAPALAELPTPCLVADLAVVRSNLRAGATAAGRLGAVLRPHAKAHRCSALLRLQLEEENTSGVTCATPGEALALARLGFADVLLANEVVSRRGVDQLAAAARLLERLTVAVDNHESVEAARGAAAAADRQLDVLIDLDVGSGRCGIPSASDEVVARADEVAASPGLRLAGLMAYASHANREPDPDRRAAVAADVKRRIALVRARLAESGFAVATVSGGSTGMWDADQGPTELQLGSYALMEASYALAVESPFEPALFCAATVVSRHPPGPAVLNCGWKAISAELGLPVAPTGLAPLAFSDEHLTCRVDGDPGPRIGDQVLLLPAHLDPTMNLHPRLFLIEHGSVVGEWRIDLRPAV
jgi:D-serine deaminase-like pyridoxal phosphate-dependent protein